ncbi:MAG TPA: sialidase family protein [Candidatus Sulfotelmatobacter sp.]|nr:sialidase family protein [Candidatus Sulfotelmatobacter sp.]
MPLALAPAARAQGAKQSIPESPIADKDADHVRERSAWFLRGRIIPGKPSAELRRRAFEIKMQMRTQRAAFLAATSSAQTSGGQAAGAWVPLGPVPLASDASGTGLQDYHQVSGRATAVAIDPADPSGNTVYIGGAQGGIWKSTNAANSIAANVTWTAIADSQSTLSIGALAIQPGNNDPTKTVILAATGEANNSADSYFGLGILRSANAGNTWTLIPSTNNGTLSLTGLGGARMAFSNANTVVAAMATTSEGLVDGAVTSSTKRGLYTSLDAGQSWTYNAITDPGGPADATSATSVVYNSAAGEFVAAIRFHGFYSSPDGVNWTRLAAQPGGSQLSTSACPPQSTSNGSSCPIYRGELTVVPGRNEMYAWYISLDFSGDPLDGGIWQSLNGGASWTEINDSGITNCGDTYGCGVTQGYYDLELQATPNGPATDLYAGAINVYKCTITAINPTCAATPFLNLTHAYGCSPIGAPAHVHPDQHAIAFTIPSGGTDSGNVLLYFANDGGVYRALNGVSGLNTGSCGGTNQFDDLNQNLGSMTQFVTFSQHPTDPNTLLGGTQDNGSPATASATTSPSWINVYGGDGGFNAIDPATPASWFISNPDIAPAGLAIQQCPDGENCRESTFNQVISSGDLGGDDGGFYFPYILDPQSNSAIVVGTCRVWRGPRVGGAFTALSPNFDTRGSGVCSGSEINLIRALAAGGPTDSNGSQVIYATTDGPGPLNLSTPVGGNVWATTNATTGTSAFIEVTGTINPNQFPVSSVAIDTSDATGKTAYVAIMGFTGSAGHVWKTTNAGSTWSDFTANLPDSPANAVVVDPAGIVFVGTDVGVFESSTSSASWNEVGPSTASGQSGFLPNVAVTALAIFNSGGQKLLRASTYGRGVWQFNLLPSFLMAITNSPQTIFPSQSATFAGTVTALGGYSSNIGLSCIAASSAPPSTCSPSPLVLLATTNTPFTLTASGAVGDYNFFAQGTGSDANQTVQRAPITLHVVNFGVTATSPASITMAPGSTSSAVTFQVTASGSFNQSVTVTCSVSIPSGTCNLTPGNTVHPTSSAPASMSASVTAPASAAVGNYTATIQATTIGAPAALTTSFGVSVVSQDFTLSSSTSSQTAASGQTTGAYNLTIQPSGNSFSSPITLACPSGLPSGAKCNFSQNPVTPGTSAAHVALTISTASSTPVGSSSITVTASSGQLSHSVTVTLIVTGAAPNSLQLATTQNFAGDADAGSQVTAAATVTANYNGKVNVACDAGALSGQCSITPSNPVTVIAGTATTLTLTLNIPGSAAPNPSNSYNVKLTASDVSGQPTQTATLPLTVIQDFNLSSTTPSQSISPGQTTGPYNLTINPVGAAFNTAITLTCPTPPPLAQCQFSPSTPITPGTTPVNLVMTISTGGASSAAQPASRLLLLAAMMGLPGLGIVWNASPRRKPKRRCARLSWLLLFVFALSSCGGGAASGSGGGGGTGPGGGAGQQITPGTYMVNVTGTSGSLVHSTPVQLVVQ